MGDLLTSFTILSHDASEPVNRTAMTMLEGAAHSARQTVAPGTKESPVRSDALQMDCR